MATAPEVIVETEVPQWLLDSHGTREHYGDGWARELRIGIE